LPQYKKIEKIIVETEGIKTFFFKSPEITEAVVPGQFLMLYVFNYIEEPGEPEEVPMSFSYIDKNQRIIGISIQKSGPTTTAMHKHLVGDSVGIRGPYGHGYEIVGSNIAIVGGGIGMAPLMPLLEEIRKTGKRVDVFVGVRNKKYLCFAKRIKDTGATLYISTEDGSEGYKGFVTDILEEQLKKQKYDYIMTSGPELMIKKILEISNKNNILLQAGLERYIKCGRGICGHCTINGLRVCKEGPVFLGSTLNQLSDFGKHAMNATGKLKPINEVFNTRTRAR